MASAALRHATAGATSAIRTTRSSRPRSTRSCSTGSNLERLTRVARDEAEPEIRDADHRTCSRRETQTTPLSLYERETLIVDVLNELFGLGPARGAAARIRAISDILVNRFDQVYVERERPLEETDIVFQRRPAPDADHRAHRQLGRPPHRRVEPDGRRAPRRRLARQRHHSAAGARRPGAVDPPLPHRSPGRRRTSSSASR